MQSAQQWWSPEVRSDWNQQSLAFLVHRVLVRDRHNGAPYNAGRTHEKIQRALAS